MTAVSLSEILIGIEILPAGKRKNSLKDGFSEIIDSRFKARILQFDKNAAIAPLINEARKAGKTISIQDSQIAAIALVHDF